MSCVLTLVLNEARAPVLVRCALRCTLEHLVGVVLRRYVARRDATVLIKIFYAGRAVSDCSQTLAQLFCGRAPGIIRMHYSCYDSLAQQAAWQREQLPELDAVVRLVEEGAEGAGAAAGAAEGGGSAEG